MPHVAEFLTPEEEEQIVEAIKEAEKQTSGEIRVHIENESSMDPFERAKEVFYYLKMDQTAEKNGVLFYISTKDHHFVVIGDEGIDRVVPDNFWESVKNHVLGEFAKGNFAKGLLLGIADAGNKLKEYFPYETKGDTNELSDEISRA